MKIRRPSLPSVEVRLDLKIPAFEKRGTWTWRDTRWLARSPSQPPIRSFKFRAVVPLIKFHTLFLHSINARIHFWRVQFRFSFNKLDSEAHADMPCDMAVHQPDARIVGVYCDNKPAPTWQHLYISSHGVSKVQIGRLTTIKMARARTENKEVMATTVYISILYSYLLRVLSLLKMNGMWNRGSE